MNDTSEPVPQDQRQTAKALEDLTSQFVVLRHGIEKWQKDVVQNLPPDYSKYFDLLVAGLGEVGDKVEALADKTDALQKVPTKGVDAIVAAGEGMVTRLGSQIAQVAGLAGTERRSLEKLIGTVGTQQQIRRWLTWTGVGSGVAGIFLGFVLAYVAPFGLDGVLAAAIMGQDRWHAGQALMQAGNPDGWNQFVADANLTHDNRTKVDACRAAAAKSKKDENCVISVPAPPPSTP